MVVVVVIVILVICAIPSAVCMELFSSLCKSSSSICDLNNSKAKLRGAKYQREKTKTRRFS